MKIAPQAEIYVARIAKDPKEILAASENVAQAIDWATTKWNVDIISMSFGYAEDQPNISRAIRKAMYKRDGSILFFAAASNSGANDKEMFPARHESVISMRATNANGDFSDFNPPRSPNEGIVLGTLGVDVPSTGLSDSGEEVYKSGTSVATAVAVGIAGALLGYSNAKQDILEKVRTRQGMQAVFRALASKTLNDHYL
ncbi:peptidase S8/S53 domain-containing protein [Aspergillus sergii]|uniref:Peptidase S8/S53 domain-containing protein n=1 Tax=Aspergillus sergii TaxID=1034303 RepID=A0A5N6WZ72_9EURO|nr:peptidase S8/S53 domain-containing protein [Aspergillus sergii]